ncbi:MAG TPA: hypothetical protein PKC18_01485 [Lacipirellulaceae bacterium]|nr:hypothetical protein [Lacipirellulaceae bacterium]
MHRFPPIFDDHCRLADADFRGVRLVEFCGGSGAGKSTAIAYLCTQHPQFRDRPVTTVDPARPLPATTAAGELVVVEELYRRRHLGAVVALLRRGATVLAASHLRPAWSAPLGLRWRRRSFTLDRDWTKIVRHLQRRGVPHSDAAVRAYCRRYGANYVDAEIILERCPEASFDAALARFERHCRLELRRTAFEGRDGSAR